MRLSELGVGISVWGGEWILLLSSFGGGGDHRKRLGRQGMRFFLLFTEKVFLEVPNNLRELDHRPSSLVTILGHGIRLQPPVPAPYRASFFPLIHSGAVLYLFQQFAEALPPP